MNEQSGESAPLTVKQSGTVPITSHVPAYIWRCELCGWIGTGWTSKHGAEKEGADHVWSDHGVAACAPEQAGGPHVWEHVKGSDSISRCHRCGRTTGK